MNPEYLLAHFKRLTSSLSRSQLATLAGVFIAVVGVLVGGLLGSFGGERGASALVR